MPQQRDFCAELEEEGGSCGAGECVNGARGHACQCPDGYAFRDDTCVDVDEVRRGGRKRER